MYGPSEQSKTAERHQAGNRKTGVSEALLRQSMSQDEDEIGRRDQRTKLSGSMVRPGPPSAGHTRGTARKCLRQRADDERKEDEEEVRREHPKETRSNPYRHHSQTEEDEVRETKVEIQDRQKKPSPGPKTTGGLTIFLLST